MIARIRLIWSRLFSASSRILDLELEIAKVRAELSTSRLALDNATRSALDAKFKMDEALARESRAMHELADALKAVANYAVHSAGSKIPIFDGAGPTLPVRTSDPAVAQAMEHGRQRARSVVNQSNHEFLAKWAKDAGFPASAVDAASATTHNQ